MTADLDKACPHPDFAVMAEVARITEFEGGPAIAFHADLTVSCAECGEQFRWSGVPAGLAAGHPTVSVDETELRAPIRPASADPDFGLGIPGFAIQVVDGG
jgi:hypothetical protein